MLEVVFRIECIGGRHFLCFCLFYSRSWVTRNLSLDVTQDASWFSRGLLCRESCWLCCLHEVPSCLSRHSLSSSTSFLFPDFLFSSWSLILSSGLLRLSSSVQRIPWLSRCTWTLSSFFGQRSHFYVTAAQHSFRYFKRWKRKERRAKEVGLHFFFASYSQNFRRELVRNDLRVLQLHLPLPEPRRDIRSNSWLRDMWNVQVN